MANEIFVIGEEDIVLMFGLIGIEGIILDNSIDFLKIFQKVTTNSSIGMIIIAADLNKDQLDFLIRYKIQNLSPFVFILPNIFKENIEDQSSLFNLKDIIKKVVS